MLINFSFFLYTIFKRNVVFKNQNEANEGIVAANEEICSPEEKVQE